MHVFRNTAGVWNLTNDYYRPTDQREVMSIIDPLTVVNSTSCYSVDSVDSCSFIETPEVFEISKDPAIFFEHESHESYEWPLRGNTAGVWNLTNDYYRPTDQREVMTIIDPLTVVNSTSCYSVDSCSFIETPGVFEISKDPAIFFRTRILRILRMHVFRNTAGVWKSHEWPLNNGYYRWLLFGRFVWFVFVSRNTRGVWSLTRFGVNPLNNEY